MGKVQIDIYKRERQWEQASLSDIDVVKGLITLRDKLDIYYNMRFHDSNPHDVKELNQGLICLYADLDVLIDNCKFNETQLKLISLLSSGYTIHEVDKNKLLDNPKFTARTYFNTICKAIVSENERLWRKCINQNYSTDKEYKICSKCGKKLPMTREYFSPNKNGKGGFRADCKFCRKK